MTKPKVVLDTNIIISSVLTPRGEAANIWEAWKNGRFDLVISNPLYAELKRTLSRLRKEGAISKTTERRTLKTVHKGAVFVKLEKIPPVTRDPKDDIVIATAVTAKADFLVTGDKDILALGKTYRKVKILKPAEFPT